MRRIGFGVALVLGMVAGTPGLGAVFSDGQKHTVTGDFGSIEVRDGPGGTTTMLNASPVHVFGDVRVFDSSVVSMTGEVDGGFFVHDRSRVMAGVSMTTNGPVQVDGSGLLTWFGDSGRGVLVAADSSTVKVVGGFVPGGILARGTSTVSISGGHVDSEELRRLVEAQDHTVVNITGGLLTGPSLFDVFELAPSSTLNVYGRDLALAAQPNDPFGLGFRSLTGELLDGNRLVAWVAGDGTVNLFNTPEPTSILVWSVLLGLGIVYGGWTRVAAARDRSPVAERAISVLGELDDLP